MKFIMLHDSTDLSGKIDHPISYLIYDTRGNGEGVVSPTLTGDHQNRITDYTAIVVEAHYDNNHESL